ncbi:MAG: Tex family protein [Spirochaetales bacterium]|nr:Tex family protein [Spirochaetales bacterium]
MSDLLIAELSRALNLKEKNILALLELMEEGATVPFIARYRKERTGGMTDEEILALRDLHGKLEEREKRRAYILESVESQGKLTESLKGAIEKAATLAELEDLYLPYKSKRKTRADKARDLGLEGLKKEIFNRDSPRIDTLIQDYARKANITPEEALKGAQDILAQEISESGTTRQKLRDLFSRRSLITSKVKDKDKDEQGKYADYYKWSGQASRVASHTLLALYRGEKEGVLSVQIHPDREEGLDKIGYYYLNRVKNNRELVEEALKDSYKRLLEPSLEKEYRRGLKEESDGQSIEIFAQNLREMLMASPLGEKRIIALDPGFRTGCKLVVLDRDGALLYDDVIYPTAPHNKTDQAAALLKKLVGKYNTEALAVGNGTAGRETEAFLRDLPFLKDIPVISVNESGASVYSAGEVARKEFPHKDVTVRGAVSIGRRLMDPLSELIKIDPRSIGVGQYQHDVDQKALKSSLDDMVEECVNRVGVNLNTAGEALLTHISGLNKTLAGRIVEERHQRGGRFESRRELLKVKGMGKKAFEQSAGFLRITDGAEPLDQGGVHPESYDIVEKMARSLGVGVGELIGKDDLLNSLNPKEFTDDERGLPTVNDIIGELKKPGLDPRDPYDLFSFDESVHTMEDLAEGMILPGLVTNVTAFGAFVDIGVHQDGLVHVSEMADRFVRDPAEVVRVNQRVNARVIQVDLKRKRIGLSLKGLDQ